jgi:DNA-binding MarR family transcriptional regulator
MYNMRPIIKPYDSTVRLAAHLFNMDILEANYTMAEKLRDLKLTKLSIVLYVNWASHNALTYNELAEALNITVQKVKAELRRLRDVFPHLFTLGLVL